MARAAAKSEPKSAPAVVPGDRVFVLFHRPDGTPGINTPGGRPVWDAAYARVVSVGERVCVELWNRGAMPPEDDFDAQAGSSLRFVSADRLFPTREDAIQASLTRTPPAAA